jgi:site-specific recombinase XerC
MTNRAIQTVSSLERIARELARDPRLPSPHTQRQYRADLRDFEAYRAGAPLTKTLVERYAAHLQGMGRAPNTINQKLAAVRWLARRMVDLAFEQSDPEKSEAISRQAARVASVRDVKGERPPRGRHLEQGELSELLRVCEADPTPAGRRDAAVLAIAWACGLRRAELAGLALADVKPIGRDAADLIIRGKGNKTRAAYLTDGAFAALADWLTVRGPKAGSLFLPTAQR